MSTPGRPKGEYRRAQHEGSLVSPDPVDPRLMRLLGGEALRGLRQRLRRQFERAKEAVPGTFRLGQLTADEHAALALLLGRPPQFANSMLVNLPALDAALQNAGIAPSLRHALERLDGAIVHLEAVREAARKRWADVVTDVVTDTVKDSQASPLGALLLTPSGLGLLKRLARQDSDAAQRLCLRTLAVLARLPAAGLPRAQLAAQTLGDAHALDAGQPTATLVLAVLRQSNAQGEPSGRADADVDIDTDTDAGPDDGDTADNTANAASGGPTTPANKAQAQERSRDLWARVGVLVNELARPALCLNLPVRPALPGLGPALAQGLPGDAHRVNASTCAASQGTGGASTTVPTTPTTLMSPGEPAYLSLRALLRSPPAWAVAGLTVYVCENPNLLAIAANQLGVRCAPLVCTEGMPAAAQRTLLQQLRQAGACLRYHGDFDWAGIAIANQVLTSHGAQAWRMKADDYEAAARVAAKPGHALAGKPVAASWDARLSLTMMGHDLAIAEEALAAGLLDDLAGPACATSTPHSP